MQMLFEFTLARAHLCHEVHRAAARFYLESEDRMEERLRCALAHQAGAIGEVGTGDSQIQQVNWLIRDLTEHLQREMQTWIDSTLQAVLNEGLRTIALTVERQTDQLACVEQDESEAGLSEHKADRIVHEAFVRSTTAIMEYERRTWSSGILLARLLETASVQAALRHAVAEEELREVVGWAYRREVFATLQQRVSAIGAIVEQECCTVQEQVLQARSAQRGQETRQDNALIRS